MKKLKSFILRSLYTISRFFFAIRVLTNKKKEPFFSMRWLFTYVKNGYYFPSYTKQNFKDRFHLKKMNGEKYVSYEGVNIYYPDSYSDSLVIENFNNLLNEQAATGNNINPHKYLLNKKLKKHWVVYDLGPAEGLQSKLWANDVKQIVLFEPAPSFYRQLLKTFEQELSTGKVIIIHAGITDHKCSITIEGQSVEFNTLEALAALHNLPEPHYIKADIEGEELALLRSSVSFLKKAPLELINITTYHRPADYIEIPEFFKQFSGAGNLSEGVVVFNRDGLVTGHETGKLYSPVIRKCLYSFEFNR